MKLVVLGANGYRPNDLGHTSCFAVPEMLYEPERLPFF
jgi:hypothetical protein